MVVSILDLLFPKKCVSCARLGVYICGECLAKIEFVEKPICPICQRQAVGGKTHPGCAGRYRLDGLVVACRYRGPVKAAIQKVKYKWIYDIEKVLVSLVSRQLWKFDVPGDVALVPIPLHAKRKRWRGFNQAEILAKSLAGSFGVPFSDPMIRIIETATQVGLKRDDRKKNVRGAFGVRQDAKVGGKSIVLCDDVYTSGATISEAAMVLKKAGAKTVWGLVVALG